MKNPFIFCALVNAVLAGCFPDKHPLVVDAASLSRHRGPRAHVVIPGPFFSSWSQYYQRSYLSPILVQPYNLADSTMVRIQWQRFHIDQRTDSIAWLAQWAASHPHPNTPRLFMVGDEPNNPANSTYGPNRPREYARDYCYFVHTLHAADPTAVFTPGSFVWGGQSPAGPRAWLTDFLDYLLDEADCSTARQLGFAEWNFAREVGGNESLESWKQAILSDVAWVNSLPTLQNGRYSALHAPVVLGTFFLDHADPAFRHFADGSPAFVARLKEAMAWLKNTSGVAHARYVQYEWRADQTHNLTDQNEYLSPEGLAFGGFEQQPLPSSFFPAQQPTSLISQSNVYQGVRLGGVYWQDQVWIAGTRYHRAIGMHAPASGPGTASFAIPVGAKYFTSIFGYARDDGDPCEAHDRGKVWVDGALKWSGELHGPTDNMALDIGIIELPANAQVLLLEVDNLDGSNACAQTTWGDPVFSEGGYYVADHPTKSLGARRVHGGLQLGGVYWQNEVWIHGNRYFRAIGMHAPSTDSAWADFLIPTGAETFTTVFGYARHDNATCSGTDWGTVYVDGQPLWSQPISGSQTSTSINIGPLQLPTGPRILRLKVEGIDGNNCAQTTWGDPYFSGSTSPGLFVSGPHDVTQGSHTWNSTVSGTTETYTVRWDVSTNGGYSWTYQGTGNSLTMQFTGSAPAYMMIMRAAAITTTSRQLAVAKHAVVVNTSCGDRLC